MAGGSPIASPMASPMARAWPIESDRAVADLLSASHTVVFVYTPDTEERTLARHAVRSALRGVLARYFDCSGDGIALQQEPGYGVRVLPGASFPVHKLTTGRPLAFISISHAPGLSAVAIDVQGAVGLDVLRNDSRLNDVEEMAHLANDYLGPHAAQALQAIAPVKRPGAFLQAWVAHEAKLKCLGVGLVEWSPRLDRQLQHCSTRHIALPAPFLGALSGVQRFDSDKLSRSHH